MPVQSSGRRWRIIALVLLAGLLASYVWYERNEGYTHGGSLMGLLYGAIALGLILLLLFFGVRKRWYRSRWGTLEGWLQSHIYLGIFTFVLILAHTGFRFQDQVAVALMIVVTLVVVSGIVGAILYKTVPRMLTEVGTNLPAEAISEEMNLLMRSMSRIASGKSEPFQRTYKRLIRETIPPPLAGWRLLFRGAGKKSSREWSGLLGLVPESEQKELRQLLVLSRQQKELHMRLVAQQRYRNLLDAWLYIHLPLSIAMIILIVAHLWGAFYYGKMPF
jgi:hypothetical protein